jgi:hypothetical protein
MRRRDLQIALSLLLAAALGVAVALIATNDNNSTTTTAAATSTTSVTVTTGANGTTTTTTNTVTNTTPQDPLPSTTSCVALWNEPTNSAARTALAAIVTREPVRVHVGMTADVPPQCLITVIANSGVAYEFAEGGGATYPYAPLPAKTSAASLPPAQRTVNALAQNDGTLEAR